MASLSPSWEPTPRRQYLDSTGVMGVDALSGWPASARRRGSVLTTPFLPALVTLHGYALSRCRAPACSRVHNHFACAVGSRLSLQSTRIARGSRMLSISTLLELATLPCQSGRPTSRRGQQKALTAPISQPLFLNRSPSLLCLAGEPQPVVEANSAAPTSGFCGNYGLDCHVRVASLSPQRSSILLLSVV